MNINIKSKGDIKLNDEIRAHVNDKLVALRKYFKHADESSIFAEVELQEEGSEKQKRFRADISISVSGEKTHAVGRGENLFSALDTAKDELARRLRREKKRRLNLLKKAGRKIKSLLRRGSK